MMGEIVIGDEEDNLPVPAEPGKTPVKYDPALAERILMMVADGKTLREIAAQPGMPTKSTIQRWIMKIPDLTTAWKAAKEMSASSLEEEALDMARVLKSKESIEFNGTRVRAFEVAMNQFRWSASHRDPATFGQTTQPNLVVPIQINTSLDIGQGGFQKTDGKALMTTYELAATVNQEYDAEHEKIEGTDYTMEPGEPKEPSGPADGADGNPFSGLDAEPEKLSFATRKPGRPLGSRKGHRKSPQKVAEAKTRYAKKGLK